MADLPAREAPADAEFVRLVTAATIPEPGNRAFDLDGRSILLCRSGGEYFALANRCPHALSSLEGGRVRGRAIFCPLHGARFDLSTGRSLNPLTEKSLRCYPVRIRNGEIEVAIPPRGEEEEDPL